jgi:hypothetical protein
MRTCSVCSLSFSPTTKNMYACPPCRSERTKSWRNKNRDKVREYEAKRWKQKRGIAYSYLKENPCSICGESRIPCLQFDHIDPSTKSFNVSTPYGKTKDEVLEEIKKCRVLCANCHAMVTAEQQGWYKHSIDKAE